MGAYLVNHRYASSRDGRTFGPFEPGTTVELDPADAQWVERDSPGCLTDVAADAEESAADSDGAAPEPRDRMHKGGRKRG